MKQVKIPKRDLKAMSDLYCLVQATVLGELSKHYSLEEIMGVHVNHFTGSILLRAAAPYLVMAGVDESEMSKIVGLAMAQSRVALHPETPKKPTRKKNDERVPVPAKTRVLRKKA